MGRPIEILDSTLRDGAQAEGVSFSVSDKISIVTELDRFGVAYIEAGNPGSNPKDAEFFRLAADLPLKTAKLCAFGSTRRKNASCQNDAQLMSLLSAGTPAVSIVGKAWDLHAEAILGVSPDENIRLISDTIMFLKDKGKTVIFDAEHFFDGFKAAKDYSLAVIDAAHSAGADMICLCDTNGGAQPLFLFEAVKRAAETLPPARIGIHCHNDTGCAVANTMLAVDAGATHVQGTFIGIGERCGNADLSCVIPNLQLKGEYICVEGGLSRLTQSALFIAEISNATLAHDKPYVGASAFAHKGGMHADGVTKNSVSFEHIDPQAVGNTRRYPVSEVSGRSAVAAKLRAIGINVTRESPETAAILESLKHMEHMGYQYEAAEASFALMALKRLGSFTPHFKLEMYRTNGEFPPPGSSKSAFAVISVEAGGVSEITAAMGNGPVNALDEALRKALGVFYPAIADVVLTDYKVRVLDGEKSTASTVRVLLQSSLGTRSWTTVGVGSDIIAASWEALTDSIEYILHLNEGKL